MQDVQKRGEPVGDSTISFVYSVLTSGLLRLVCCRTLLKPHGQMYRLVCQPGCVLICPSDRMVRPFPSTSGILGLPSLSRGTSLAFFSVVVVPPLGADVKAVLLPSASRWCWCWCWCSPDFNGSVQSGYAAMALATWRQCNSRRLAACCRSVTRSSCPSSTTTYLLAIAQPSAPLFLPAQSVMACVQFSHLTFVN